MKAFLATLAVVPLVLATGPKAPLPPCTDDYTPFTKVGCFQDDDSASPALIYRSLSNQREMTIEQCTSECKGNGFRYAGIKYEGVCYCGSSYDAPQVDDSLCSIPCSGDNEEICGGVDQTVIYEDPTFSTVPSDVSLDDYESLGCYTDDSEDRALAFKVDVDAGTFTTETCLSACLAQGLPYAGTQFGNECWCGTDLGAGAEKSDSNQCNTPCQGDDSVNCGGPERLTLYYAKSLVGPAPCGVEPPAVTTTTGPSVSATTTDAICTATSTVAPDCEFKCGKWCAPALPDWTDKSGCKSAAKTCLLQVASCLKHAGWPEVTQCFEFSRWCSNVKSACDSDCKFNKCSKKQCWDKYKPGAGAKAPTTKTTTFPCAATTTTMMTTTIVPTQTACPPEPTNICKQPTNDKYGYGPDKPVADIALPVVGCNDIKEDFGKNPFKFYNNAKSRSCPSFSWHKRPNVCAEACEEQYEECKETYVKSCENTSWRGNGHGRRDEDDAEEQTSDLEARTFWWSKSFSFSGSSKWGGSGLPSTCAARDDKKEWFKKGCDALQCWGKGANTKWAASKRCRAQYKDCLAVNKKVTVDGMCKSYCSA
ncbi:wsc domain-containing [Emericellopsis cladophorae]|uniref:Wsc domain-containing n=1 Tax=Emericellopsis cladophorae TaxID=2686198 RepID=A0A9P9XUF0_9HYPO|nr:wsc domain-containing [Emericellopsis cladophorae]KAI6778002.1 wsc domain-containing [Emericellopsis cladophorae]